MTSYGFYLPTLDKLVHNIKESRIKTLLRKTKGQNDIVLFHHRRSTSTPDVRNACHPFSTKDAFDSEYIGIHNGMISNSYALRDKHRAYGVEYVSTQVPDTNNVVKFNDSEALIYDLALYFEGKIDKLEATGSDAFIVLKRDPTGKAIKLFFGRNASSPLVMQRSKRSLVISSIGKGEIVPPNMLHIFDFETKTLRVIPMEIPVSSWGNYRKPAPSATTYGPQVSDAYRNSHTAHLPEKFDKDEDGEFRSYWDWKKETEGWEDDDDYAIDGDTDNITPEDFSDEDNLVIADMLRKNRESNRNKENYTIPLEDYYGFGENGEFEMRLGGKRDIKAAFIRENGGRISAASLAAEGEIEGCTAETERLRDMDISNVSEDEALESLDYYIRIDKYCELLSEVAVELYKDAKTQQERALKQAKAKKEDDGSNAKGFLGHGRKNISNEQRKLLY